MKMYTVIFLLILPLHSFSQNYFEGEIIYNLETSKKDPSFDLNNILSWPSKTSKFVAKDGNFMQLPDDGIFEYQYFSRVANKMFYKVRGLDTLIFENYMEKTLGQDSILSVRRHNNTDTILNRICHSIVLQTRNAKLSFVYSPDLRINPEWYKNTEGGYYNIIYGHMKSFFLKFTIENDKFISKGVAKQIVEKSVPDSFFPDIVNLPQKALE